jgi:hypothetical protein
MEYIFIILLIVGFILFRMFRFNNINKKVKIISHDWNIGRSRMTLKFYHFHLIYKKFNFEGYYGSNEQLNDITLRSMVIQYETRNGLKEKLDVKFDCLIQMSPKIELEFEFDVTLVSDNHLS